MRISVEFSGGLETYFDNQKSKQVQLADGSNVQALLDTLANQSSKPEMFLQDGLVRPGVLVLINDQDWELLDQEQYVLQENDEVLFASTLHGG